MARRDAREIAMKLFYQKELAGEADIDAVLAIETGYSISKRDTEYIEDVLKKFKENANEIDNYIKRFAKDWSFSRIARVDLSILRLAICEILYCDDIPACVSINEGIELAKIQWRESRQIHKRNSWQPGSFSPTRDGGEEQMKKYILGLDTSCYTTSMALVDMNGNTVLNRQIPLDVEAGERGLQQSKALFQHLHRLPAITEELGKAIDPKTT